MKCRVYRELVQKEKKNAGAGEPNMCWEWDSSLESKDAEYAENPGFQLLTRC